MGPGSCGRAVGASGPLRSVEAGNLASAVAGRIGRWTRLPEQLGQTPCKTPSAQLRQNVHSKLQITASVLSAGNSLPQCSQSGLSSSMASPSSPRRGNTLTPPGNANRRNPNLNRPGIPVLGHRLVELRLRHQLLQPRVLGLEFFRALRVRNLPSVNL